MMSQKSELLDRVLEAHGGLDRWSQFSRVEASITSGGALWGMKGLRQDSMSRQMLVWLHEQRASVMPFGAPNQRTAYSPGRIAIETVEGKVVAERPDPRASFEGHNETSPWDPLHRAYFNGYALWSYMTMPFLFSLPGVTTKEIEPWQEGVELWRRLRVRFPSDIATHCETQDFYFGGDFLLRRHDYSVDVSGGILAAQYVYDYVASSGLLMPSKRRAYRRSDDGQAIQTKLLVSIDINNVNYI